MGMIKFIIIIIIIIIQLFSFSYQFEENDWIVSEYQHRRCRADDGMLIVRTVNNTNVCRRKNQIKPNTIDGGWIPCGEDTIMYLNLCVSRYPNYKAQEMLHIRNMYLPCRYDEFQCEISKRCLPRSWVQDGYDDCSTDISSINHRASINHRGNSITERITDGSDESRYFDKCFQETEFRCHSGVKSRCIPRRMVMDGKEDCLNGTDEKTPLTCHNHTEFMCIKSGRCILRDMVNDGARDCPNGGDEMLANFTCIERFEFNCTNRCIPRKLVQNGIEDCSSGEDESSVLSKCLDSEFRCIRNGRCLPHKYLCDGVPNCSDGSDEIELCTLSTMFREVRHDGRVFFLPFFLLHPNPYDSFILKQNDEIRRDVLIGFKCYVSDTGTTTLRFIPQLYLYNNFTTCYNKEDICFDGESGGKFLCARCLDGTIISRSQICDGSVDCRDLSDECVCENSRVEALCELVFSSPSSKFDFGIIFDGQWDLEEGLDEKFYQNQLYGFELEEDNFTCSYADVTRKDRISHQGNIQDCDGKFDCPLKDDECRDECLSKLVFSLIKKNIVADGLNITNKGKLLNILQTCFPFLKSTVEGEQGTRIIYLAQFRAATTEKGWEIQKYDHNQTAYCEYLIGLEDLGPSGIGVVLHNTAKQRNNCTTYQHHRGLNFLCDIPGADCSWHFYCHSDPSKKVEVSKRCDYKFDCEDKSDEKNCPEESHFYCTVGPPRFVARSQVGDGRSDCSDRSDECKETSFSSATEMLKHLFFRRFIWVCSLPIILSNAIILRKHIRKIREFTTKTSVPYCNTFLLVNLALSDMIVGLTLLAVGVKSLQFSGRYCKFDLAWRSSLACNLIGVSTLISSQTSMNLLAVMTGLRLYVTYKPFKSNQLSVGLIRLLAIFCWASSAAIASYPVWGSRSFVHSLFVERNLFLNDHIVNLNSVVKYIERTKQTMSLLNLSYATTDSLGATDYNVDTLSDWYFNTKNGSAKFPNRQVNVKADFGFYSNSSVCFPEFYSKRSPAAEYSLAIILYNLACLVFIVVGYILIIYRTKKSRRTLQIGKIETKEDKQSNKMRRRIFFIILTDVLCWLPIIIMSILSYRGYDLTEIVHPLSAIVFMPINSLINPIIYARLDEIVTLKFKQLLGKVRNRHRVNKTKTAQVEALQMQEFSLNAITK